MGPIIIHKLCPPTTLYLLSIHTYTFWLSSTIDKFIIAYRSIYIPNYPSYYYDFSRGENETHYPYLKMFLYTIWSKNYIR